MTIEVNEFAGMAGGKAKNSIYRDYGVARFSIPANQVLSNEIDIGSAASIAIFCPSALNGRTVSIESKVDKGNPGTWATILSRVLATGMNYFTGDDAIRVMHCQVTRMRLDSSIVTASDLLVSVKG